MENRDDLEGFLADCDPVAAAEFRAAFEALSSPARDALGLMGRVAPYGPVRLCAFSFRCPVEADLFDRCLIELASFGWLRLYKRSGNVGYCFPPRREPDERLREKAALALAAIRRRGASVH